MHEPRRPTAAQLHECSPIEAPRITSVSRGASESPFDSADDSDGRSRAASHRIAAGHEARLRRVAADIVRSVQFRLPGRVRDLKVRIDDGQFVLSGVSSSYYVKQVAQHLAMSALDKVMLGRLVNEIEVRSMR